MSLESPWLAAQWPRVQPHLPDPPARVVEIGCGPLGGFVPVLNSSGYEALGVDPAAPDGAGYRQEKVERAELPPQVDAVVACASLHHVDELGVVLDRIVQLLAPGGVMVVVEWGWESFDEPTARWCFERLGPSEGWLHRRREGWSASAESWGNYVKTWAGEHRIHTGSVVLEELDRHLRRRLCERGAYFYATLADTTEADELEAIRAGEIRANRIEYVGTVP